MIPYGKQSIDRKDIEQVVDVLRSDFITQGPKIEKFEKALARYCGAKYAVASSSGTAALHLAYLVLGLRVGDEVITTPNTFAATANMIAACGSKPVFSDIRPDTYNLDEGKITSSITKRTKAIVPVHLAGQPCEMEKIAAIAKKYRLSVIEDACHALGSRYKDSRVGDCHYSDITVFSFHPVKSITTGEGGAALTNNKKLYQRMVLLRNHGIHKNKTGRNVMTDLGYNYRMTDIQAALGLSQLQKVSGFIRRRNQVAKWYGEALGNSTDIFLPKVLPENYSAWHIYVIKVQNSRYRDKLALFLKKNGIGVNFHYPAVYSHPYYRVNGYKNTRLANEEKYHKSCLTLPCYPGLTRTNVRLVAALINKFFNKK